MTEFVGYRLLPFVLALTLSYRHVFTLGLDRAEKYVVLLTEYNRRVGVFSPVLDGSECYVVYHRAFVSDAGGVMADSRTTSIANE